MTTKEALQHFSTNLTHALSFGAMTILEREHTPSEALKIWNGRSKKAKAERYRALWLAYWEAAHDDEITITATVTPSKGTTS